MTELEYTMIEASLKLMTVEELGVLRLEMAKRHDETQEEEAAMVHDAINSELDWQEVLESYGMTEEEYARYWKEVEDQT